MSSILGRDLSYVSSKSSTPTPLFTISNPNLPSESIANGLMMIESVMTNPTAAAKVINVELVQRIMSILKDNKTDPAIALSCLRVLEKVGKTDAGLSMIQQCGGEGIINGKRQSLCCRCQCGRKMFINLEERHATSEARKYKGLFVHTAAYSAHRFATRLCASLVA